MMTLAFKLGLLLGRPIAFLGVLMLSGGLLARDPSQLAAGVGFLAIGFVSAWIGRIGLFLTPQQ